VSNPCVKKSVKSEVQRLNCSGGISKPTEGGKKLGGLCLRPRNGRLIETLGRGSSDVMNNVPV
jgi:hypothetical protein